MVIKGIVRVIRYMVIFMLIIALIITAIIGILIIDEEYQIKVGSRLHAKDNIEFQTGITIPEEAKIIYHQSQVGLVNGRAPHYTVFEFDQEPTQWLTDNKFSSCDVSVNEDGGEDSGFGTYFGEGIIAREKVPEMYWPNFVSYYLWQEKNLVYFYYFPNTLRLIVYISWT